MRFLLDDTKDFHRQLKSFVMGVRPVMEFVSKEDAAAGKVAAQESKVDDNGQLLHRWEIHMGFMDDDSPYGDSEPFKCKLFAPAGQDLKTDLPGGTPIALGGLRVNIQERKSGDGKGYSASFSAESYTTTRPPSQRATAPSEPVTASVGKDNAKS